MNTWPADPRAFSHPFHLQEKSPGNKVGLKDELKLYPKYIVNECSIEDSETILVVWMQTHWKITTCYKVSIKETAHKEKLILIESVICYVLWVIPLVPGYLVSNFCFANRASDDQNEQAYEKF